VNFILFTISAIAWIWVWHRIKNLEDEFDSARVQRHEFAALTWRVFALEQIAPPPIPKREPEKPAPAPPAEPVFTAPAAVEPAAERPAPPRREWEALIGGSILNAVGAVVLVIGIALFLVYSFAHMTAAGRATLATIASVAILGAGVRIERKPRYRVFARGLIGAGWAALYATSYAIYAIPAAQVLPNAVAGSIVQLAVALGMVTHSLRYRAQAVTLVAYSAVFAALAVTPSSPFAVASLIPIAASVLYLAAKFEWDYVPLFGLVATYLTCISRGESDATLATSQSLFLTYWLIFELFDLRRVKFARIAGGIEFLFPLNAGGFLGLSYLAWNHHAPDRLWFASGCAAALFLASSIVRAMLLPRNSSPLFERLRQGGFEASLTVSALLAVMAIVGRAPGIWAAAALAVESEILYLSGVRFDSRFVRGLGTAVFGYSLGRLALTTAPGGTAVILGHSYRDWAPAVLLHAALFYWNRAIRPLAIYFSYAASALIAIILLAEMPHSTIGFAWAALGFVLLELGLVGNLREYRLQAYCLLAAGVFAGCGYALANQHAPWWPLAATVAVTYACAIQSRGTPEIAGWLSFAASFGGAVLLWRTLPHTDVALSWAGLALALEIAGEIFQFPELKWPAPIFSTAALLAACVIDINPPRLAISIPTAAIFYAQQFFARRGNDNRLVQCYSLLGTTLAATVLFDRVSGGLLTVAWGLLGLSLLGSGFATRERILRLQGLALLLICILKLFLYDLRNLETLYRILSFVALGLILLSVSWIYSRFRDHIVRLL
jgi:hypothetical protein